MRAGYWVSKLELCNRTGMYVFSGAAGVDYVFTVTASKGTDDGEAWARLRSDNASCVVSTSASALPQVSINPKVGKQNIQDYATKMNKSS